MGSSKGSSSSSSSSGAKNFADYVASYNGTGGSSSSGSSSDVTTTSAIDYNEIYKGDGAAGKATDNSANAPTTDAGRNAVGYGLQSAVEAMVGTVVGGPLGAISGIDGVVDAANASDALSKGTVTQATMTDKQRDSLLGGFFEDDEDEAEGGGLGGNSTGPGGDAGVSGAQDSGDHY